MKVAIVTYYDNQQRYILGQKRQQESLEAVGYTGDYYAFNSVKDIDSPEHLEVPYAFKCCAIKKVVDMGYDIVIWMDSPVYAIKDIGHFIQFISDSEGVVLFDNLGYTIGDYTSDRCLELKGWSRDKAFENQMIMACLMAFDMRKQQAKDFVSRYYEAHKTEGMYQGDWANYANQVSTDNRVKGHRHDQSVASIIAADMGIKLLHPYSTFFAYFGNLGHLPHAESVCLISQGY